LNFGLLVERESTENAKRARKCECELKREKLRNAKLAAAVVALLALLIRTVNLLLLMLVLPCFVLSCIIVMIFKFLAFFTLDLHNALQIAFYRAHFFGHLFCVTKPLAAQ